MSKTRRPKNNINVVDTCRTIHASVKSLREIISDLMLINKRVQEVEANREDYQGLAQDETETIKNMMDWLEKLKSITPHSPHEVPSYNCPACIIAYALEGREMTRQGLAKPLGPPKGKRAYRMAGVDWGTPEGAKTVTAEYNPKTGKVRVIK